MLYSERLDFVKEYVNHWAGFDECSPIANGFKCWGCTALFIEADFNIHFGFYDPEGQKLAEYQLNTETGTAVMIYDERYTGEDRNEYTGALADVLGGLLGSEEYFILINKPVMVCMDNDDKVYSSTKDLVEDLMRDIMSPFRPRKVENKNNDADLFGIAEVE